MRMPMHTQAFMLTRSLRFSCQAVHQPDLQWQIHTDLQQAVQHISSLRQVDHVRAKLECITHQSCPQFHADTVGVRMLCTYTGPGTWYIENRCAAPSLCMLAQWVATLTTLSCCQRRDTESSYI